MEINYLHGDATNPQGEGNMIIPHIVNDLGAWGAGFVLALSKKWNAPENVYRLNAKHDNIQLGTIHTIQVESNIYVCNMVGQHGIGYDKGVPPIRYDALKQCLIEVNKLAININASLHCPKFGAGLAGGNWSEIEKIIEETITVPVYVYEF